MSSHSDSRVAVVTGAAGGIGAAIAARLAADGFAVAGADLAEGADHRCDVRSEADVQRLRDEVTARLAAPSLLVNVAGVFFEHRITDLAVDDWDLILDTNLKGTFLTCKTFLPAMIAARSGCIVNVASTAGIRGGRTRAAYCAAKAGVVNLTRSLALDHGGDGVRCGLLRPRHGARRGRRRHGLDDLAPQPSCQSRAKISACSTASASASCVCGRSGTSSGGRSSRRPGRASRRPGAGTSSSCRG